MWKNYIEEISKEYHFKAPATSEDILYIKEELNVELSKQLLDLLSETNGILDSSNYPLVKENLFFRNFDDYKDIYMPFDHLLFFLM